MSNIMSKEELHKYGVELMISMLKKEGYSIIEVNEDINTNPQLIVQKSTDMSFVIVRTFMYPKKNVAVDQEEIDMIKQGANAYNARCFIAQIGLAFAEGKNAKELGTPYKNAGFLVKYRGLEEI